MTPTPTPAKLIEKIRGDVVAIAEEAVGKFDEVTRIADNLNALQSLFTATQTSAEEVAKDIASFAEWQCAQHYPFGTKNQNPMKCREQIAEYVLKSIQSTISSAESDAGKLADNCYNEYIDIQHKSRGVLSGFDFNGREIIKKHITAALLKAVEGKDYHAGVVAGIRMSAAKMDELRETPYDFRTSVDGEKIVFVGARNTLNKMADEYSPPSSQEW